MVLSNREKSSPQYTLQGTTNGKNGTRKLSNLNEVDEMVIFIVGADGGEELFEWGLLSVGQCPVTHIKS